MPSFSAALGGRKQGAATWARPKVCADLREKALTQINQHADWPISLA